MTVILLRPDKARPITNGIFLCGYSDHRDQELRCCISCGYVPCFNWWLLPMFAACFILQLRIFLMLHQRGIYGNWLSANVQVLSVELNQITLSTPICWLSYQLHSTITLLVISLHLSVKQFQLSIIQCLIKILFVDAACESFPPNCDSYQQSVAMAICLWKFLHSVITSYTHQFRSSLVIN